MYYALLFSVVSFLGACSDDGNDASAVDTPLYQTSVYPSEGDVVQPGSIVVRFGFDQNVWLLDKSLITLNDEVTDAVAAIGNEVLVNVTATAGNSYEVRLAAGSIRSVDGYVSVEDYVTTFSCEADASSTDTVLSTEAQNLLNYIEEINGTKILSGAMANVAWNTNEAYWVYTKTGKYPAINCVDFIHLYASAPGSWIDYSQTQFIEDWWANNGIVAAMWHWNVPNNDGTGYTPDFVTQKIAIL